ncbi:MAG: NAD-dependent epimerase/dehydratase family protein [Aulosira sp. DedQUE10]|nr:NAD-dependent epimerase/dehydratase family protein [Aulosira sp. DedQUE10]
MSFFPKTPRLLIIGGGAVVAEYYLPALYVLGYAEQALIIDASASTLAILKQKYPQIQVQQVDFRSFLENTASNLFDAVVVALPNWLHEEACLKALERGWHILCEKPLTLNKLSCLKLAEQAEQYQRILTVGMVRRLLPSVGALRQALHQGLIGKLNSVDIEDGGIYAWLSDSGAFFRKENGGVLADIGIHYLDMIESLLGKLTPLKYQDDYQGGVEANLEFYLETNSKIPVRLALSRTRKLQNQTIFKGELGELIIEKNIFDRCFWRSPDSQLTAELQAVQPFSSSNWSLSFESCFAEQFLRFAIMIDRQSSPDVSATEAASTIGLIEWAYSYRTQLKSYALPTELESKRPKLPVAPAIVTGGTGFIGINLVERLYELGFNQITVPVRNYRTCAEVARFPVQLPLIDLLNYEQVKTAIAGKHYVFHLAYGRDGNQTAQVTVQGTKNVVEAAIEVGAECVVVLSTMYVFGHPDTKDQVDETWPYASTGGEYGKTKAQMEQWCLERAKSSPKTRIVVLNPSCVYGPGGKTYSQMPLQMAQHGGFCWIEEGKGIANYVFVNNLIDAILLAVQSPKAHGERFLITDGVATWREFITPLLGNEAKLPSYTKEQLLLLNNNIPHTKLVDVLKAIAKEPNVMDKLRQTYLFKGIKNITQSLNPKLIDQARKIKQPPKQSVIIQSATNKKNIFPIWLADLFGTTSTIFSSAKAHQILGWQPLISLEQGQKLTKDWLRFINLLKDK